MHRSVLDLCSNCNLNAADDCVMQTETDTETIFEDKDDSKFIYRFKAATASLNKLLME